MNYKNAIMGIVFLAITCGNLFSQGQVSLHFTSKSVIDFIVTDPEGNKTGKDPRGAGITYTEIPSADYGVIGFGDDLFIVEFSYFHTSPYDDGTYSIKLIGKELSSFSYKIVAEPKDTLAQKVSFTIDTFLDKDAEQTYTFSYPGNQNSPARINKVISITTLVQDVTTGEKLKMVGNQTFTKNVLSQLHQMASFYNSGNKANAHKKLNTVKGLIQNAYYGPTGSEFINAYANAVLMEDIRLTFALIGDIGINIDSINKKK